MVSYFGEPINILSQLDFTNGKIAYNPKHDGDIKHILLDTLDMNQLKQEVWFILIF